MNIIVNGVDLMPYLVKDGIKWTRSDLDGPNAGRLMDGEMQRDRVAIKYRWDFTCKPLTEQELSKILTAIQPELYTVTITDPTTMRDLTTTCYSNNFNITAYGIIDDSGSILWEGVSFPVIQK